MLNHGASGIFNPQIFHDVVVAFDVKSVMAAPVILSTCKPDVMRARIVLSNTVVRRITNNGNIFDLIGQWSQKVRWK